MASVPTDRIGIVSGSHTGIHSKTGAGQIVGINVAAEEITDRKRIEADLAANQEEFRNINIALAKRVAAQAQERDRIWKLSQDLFVVSDSSGNILNINPAWSTILGWSTDDLVGKSAVWLLHPEDRERSFAERANLSAGRKTLHFENRLMGKDGFYRWLSWFAVPDRGLIYATGRDISNLKKAEEQLHIVAPRTCRRFAAGDHGCDDGIDRSRNQTAADCNSDKR